MVLRLVPLIEIAHGEQSRAQLPLVLEHAGGVRPQHTARQREGTAQALPYLSVDGLHSRRVWMKDRERERERGSSERQVTKGGTKKRFVCGGGGGVKKLL